MASSMFGRTRWLVYAPRGLLQRAQWGNDPRTSEHRHRLAGRSGRSVRRRHPRRSFPSPGLGEHPHAHAHLPDVPPPAASAGERRVHHADEHESRGRTGHPRRRVPRLRSARRRRRRRHAEPQLSRTNPCVATRLG
ncbi:hypothetical protein ACFPRL_26200 [Pseudoclavibacter helvolus]